jgi:hypothetical protein
MIKFLIIITESRDDGLMSISREKAPGNLEILNKVKTGKKKISRSLDKPGRKSIITARCLHNENNVSKEKTVSLATEDR